jgi:hypothetical protein
LTAASRRKSAARTTRAPKADGLIGRGRSRYGRCQLYRPGDPRCTGPSEVELTDRFDYRLWGCTRHAAQAMRIVPGTRISNTKRRTAIADVQAWLDGKTPRTRT